MISIKTEDHHHLTAGVGSAGTHVVGFLFEVIVGLIFVGFSNFHLSAHFVDLNVEYAVNGMPHPNKVQQQRR